jgi:hypothetical protein
VSWPSTLFQPVKLDAASQGRRTFSGSVLLVETYEELKAKLLKAEDEGIRAWTIEKGISRNEYELRRMWKRITSYNMSAREVGGRVRANCATFLPVGSASLLHPASSVCSSCPLRL